MFLRPFGVDKSENSKLFKLIGSSFTYPVTPNYSWTSHRLSCVAKHRISIGKKSNLRHSRDRWLKDIKRKKDLKGKTIERVHLSQEYLLVAKISLTDCYKRYKKARQFFDLTLIQWLFIAFPEFHFTIQNLKCKRATEVDLLLLAHKLANHIHSFG